MYQDLREKTIDAYMATIPLITLNIVWFVASLPLVTVIPATAALYYATNQVAHGKPATVGTFIEGFRVCFRRSWTWGLLNLAVVAAAVAYVYIFSHAQELWTVWASAVVVVIFFVWLTVQMYVFPLLLEQVEPKLMLAIRNSLIMVLKRPLYSMGVTLVLLALAAASTVFVFPAWLLITAGACTYLANLATLSSIRRVTGRIDTPATVETPSPEA